MSGSVFIKQTVTLISFQAGCHLELAVCVGGCAVCQEKFWDGGGGVFSKRQQSLFVSFSCDLYN